jgi:hypothetical protein
MVRDGFYVRPVQRKLSVSIEVIQLRLSVVFSTLVTFVVALLSAAIAHFREPVNSRGQHMSLPQSRLDWIEEAIHQHHGEDDDHDSPADCAKKCGDLSYVSTTSASGLPRRRITAPRDTSLSQPFLDPYSPYKESEPSWTTQPSGAQDTSTPQPFERYFDAHVLYNEYESSPPRLPPKDILAE